MRLRHLSLSNFRNYRRQELDLPRGPSLLLGDNAQGKSNLLEAAFLLATMRSERAQVDGELIHQEAWAEPQPVARVVGEIERKDGPVQIEVVIAGRSAGDGPARPQASKRLRVNGLARRQIDAAGQLIAVLFTTEDVELISGAPGARRRYLDISLSQLDATYARALQRYTKVVTQRNALLRRIQEGDAGPEELDFWDEELARDGAVIVLERAAAVAALAQHAREEHHRVSGGNEELAIAYQPRLEAWSAGAAEAEAAMREALVSGRRRDIGAGATLSGPHRDDLSFAIDGSPAASYASRGQQRTAALALRLAEARYMAQRRGDQPVVLLDDVLSELDEGRRQAVLESLGEWDQLLMTSADADRFGEGLAHAAAVFRVVAGRIEAA